MIHWMNILADMGTGRFAAILLAVVVFLCLLLTRA